MRQGVNTQETTGANCVRAVPCWQLYEGYPSVHGIVHCGSYRLSNSLQLPPTHPWRSTWPTPGGSPTFLAASPRVPRAAPPLSGGHCLVHHFVCGSHHGSVAERVPRWPGSDRVLCCFSHCPWGQTQSPQGPLPPLGPFGASLLLHSRIQPFSSFPTFQLWESGYQLDRKPRKLGQPIPRSECSLSEGMWVNGGTPPPGSPPGYPKSTRRGAENRHRANAPFAPPTPGS